VTLRARLSQSPIVVAPGVSDALTALLAEQAGFEALYLSGASIAYTRLARPDIGLVTASEVENTLANIRERTALPILVDADTGFGNALNVRRTVRMIERAGAGGGLAIQLEDQTLPKRCGHLDGKTLVPAGEMVGKIKAALDERRSRETLVIARTDAVAVEDLPSALDRAARYADAGADVVFIEALRNEAEMRTATARFAGRVPVLVNMVEGGKTPLLPAATLQALGFAVVIFPGALTRAIAHAARAFLQVLRREGTTASQADRMLDFKALNELIGTPAMLELGKRYEDGPPLDGGHKKSEKPT
jgi:2-methylisocitrate lyase-like PEP mutase family enzyme